MIRCHTCQTANLDTSRFCDECGTRLIKPADDVGQEPIDHTQPPVEQPVENSANIDSGFPAAVEPLEPMAVNEPIEHPAKATHAKLVIERGGTAGTEFGLTSDESIIGRWDA